MGTQVPPRSGPRPRPRPRLPQPTRANPRTDLNEPFGNQPAASAFRDDPSSQQFNFAHPTTFQTLGTPSFLPDSRSYRGDYIISPQRRHSPPPVASSSRRHLSPQPSDDSDSELPPVSEIVKVAPAKRKSDENPAPAKRSKAVPKARVAEKAVVKKENKSGGRQAGSKGYSKEENLHFLGIAKVIEPVGGKGWEEVAKRHNKAGCFPKREPKSLREKLAKVRKLLSFVVHVLML
jgi:hypothetical protein